MELAHLTILNLIFFLSQFLSITNALCYLHGRGTIHRSTFHDMVHSAIIFSKMSADLQLDKKTGIIS
jgi:hypothetical protein